MTERLYYPDPQLLEFEATIVATGELKDRIFTLLDQSAFYPTSGGQLHDTGSLNDIRIIDVVETDAGEVSHLSKQVVGAVGETVVGRVDEARRRQFRQTHTAQHILSAALHHLYDLRTESVHLGEEYGLVEIGAGEFSDDQMLAVEAAASEIIASNVPIQILFLDREEAAKLPMRKEPQREGKLRLIQIGDYDYSACGGTHCSSTAEVGLVKLIGREKVRARTGLRFLAGAQALADYRTRFSVSDQLAKAFTCHVEDLTAQVSSLKENYRASQMRLAQCEKTLLPIRAREIADRATADGRWTGIALEVTDWEQTNGDKLAGAVAAATSGWALLLVGERLFLAVAENSGLKAGQLAKELARRCGIRGGGNDRLAQFGGVAVQGLSEYRAALLELLKDA